LLCRDEDECLYDIVFGNDNSDGEFKGYLADYIDENYRGMMQKYEAEIC